jgi:hypothetical protein
MALSEFKLGLCKDGNSGSLGRSLRRASRDDTWWDAPLLNTFQFHVPPLRGCIVVVFCSIPSASALG